MATKGVYFNGKQLTIPNVYAAIDSSTTTSKTAASSAKVIALIGECEGGEPEAIHFFSEPSVAKNVLKAGNLLKAAQKAWNPVSKTKEGVELGGADIIACIRSNRATKANTVVPQSSDTSSSIGSIAYSISPTSTHPIAVLNTDDSEYIGTKNETIRIEVLNVTKTDDEHKCTVAWKYMSENAFHDQIELNIKDGDIKWGCTYEALQKVTGVSVHLGSPDVTGDDLNDVSVNTGDYVLIPCICATSKTDSKYVVSAKDWGKSGNAISHSQSDGTISGTKKFTVYDSATDVYETYNNLGLAFSIQYTGSEQYAAISVISNGEGKAIKLQTYIGTDKDNCVVDLDMDLSTKSYKNIKALVTAISAYDNYNVSLSEYVNTNLLVTDLDFCDRQSITETKKMTAYVMDLQNKLDRGSKFCEITDINREVITMGNYPLTQLSGGSEGTSPSSWEKYFKMLGRYPVYYITPLTDDMSIIAECLSHCNEMTETFGRERRMVCGGGNRLSVADAKDAAKKINASRAQYVYPGFYDLNDEGELELYPAYILAAQHAGRAAFLPDGEAATHDVYRMAACEYEIDPTDTKELIGAGVVTFNLVMADDVYSSSSIIMVQDLTTNTDSENPLDTERAVGAIADGINKDIRNSIEYVATGKKGGLGLVTSIKTKTIGVLEKKLKKEEVIVAYKDVSVIRSNGVTTVEYSVATTTPNNFTLIQGHMYDEDIAV